MELGVEDKKLAVVVMDEISPTLMVIHHVRGLSKEDALLKMAEDASTICILIKRGHLILKHKEGGTLNDILTKLKTKDCEEDSTASSKRFKVDGE